MLTSGQKPAPAAGRERLGSRPVSRPLPSDLLACATYWVPDGIGLAGNAAPWLRESAHRPEFDFCLTCQGPRGRETALPPAGAAVLTEAREAPEHSCQRERLQEQRPATEVGV